MRILLGQLASNGDCLYATAIARQIKADYPGCHLTWAIGSFCRPMIEGNPYVDEIWEIEIPDRHHMDDAWRSFEKVAKKRFQNGEFDKIFLTQINPNNFQNFDGTVRSSLFRAYPGPITVPVQPVLRLREDERANVREFAESNNLKGREFVILFECASSSGQSFVTPSFAVATASAVVARKPNVACILSSNIAIRSDDERIIDGSRLRLRENAELTNYCHLIVGCSSGVSWICTSDAAAPLPFVQLLKKSTSVFASMQHDAEYFGLPTDHIMEMTECSPEHLADCLVEIISNGFPSAKKKYHEQIPVKLDLYFEVFMRAVLRSGHPVKFFTSMRHVLRRYGSAPFLEYFRDLVRVQ
jgi:hypothetical protein